MAMPNIAQIQAMLQNVPDQQLIEMYKSPSPTVPQVAVLMELQRRQQMRQQGQAQGMQQQQAAQAAQQGTQQVLARQQADKLGGGVGQLPAPNMVQMAEGGIVGYAGGGTPDAARQNPSDEDLRAMYADTDSGIYPLPLQQGSVSGIGVRRRDNEIAARQNPSDEDLSAIYAATGSGVDPWPLLGSGAKEPKAQAPNTAFANGAGRDLRVADANVNNTQGNGTNPHNDPMQPELDIFGIPKGVFAKYMSEKPHNASEFTISESLNRSDDAYKHAKNVGLLAAGLGMMAAKSPFALANIGEGGLQGLQAYQGALGQDQANRAKAAQTQSENYRADVGYNAAIDSAQLHNLSQYYLLSNQKFMQLQETERNHVMQTASHVEDWARQMAAADPDYIGTRDPTVKQAKMREYLKQGLDHILNTYKTLGIKSPAIGSPSQDSTQKLTSVPPGATVGR